MSVGTLESSDSSRITFSWTALDQITLWCPACALEVVVPVGWAGGRTRCSVCRCQVRIPRRAGDLRRARQEVVEAPAVTGQPLPDTRRVSRLERATHARADAKLRRLSARSQRNVTHERHLRALAVLQGEFALGTLLICLLLSRVAAWVGAASLGAVAFVLLGLAAAQAIVSYGLWTYQNWARLVAAGLTLLGVVVVWVGMSQQPLGMATLWGLVDTVWAGAVLWALLGYGAMCLCNEGYRDLVARTPEVGVSWWISPFFWLPHVPLAVSLIAVVFSKPVRTLVWAALGL